MRLHSVSMVRDEEDVIESFVRHTLTCVDTMHIVVHRSRDSTPAILSLLRDEGLPIEVTVNEDKVFRQGMVQTGLARSALQLGADFVFVLDADEFLRVPSRAQLEQKLAALPSHATAAVAWQSYIPLPSDDWREPDIVKRIAHRPIEERKLLGKVILGQEFRRDESLQLLEGSHWVYRKSGEEYLPQSMEVFTDMWLAHFPVRSIEQAVAKLLQRRWQRRIAWVDEPISKLFASGFRTTIDRMTEIILDRGILTPEELSWFAYDYNGPYDPGGVPPLDAYRDLLVRDPCADGSQQLRYASRIGNPLAGFYRWLDEILK